MARHRENVVAQNPGLGAQVCSHVSWEVMLTRAKGFHCMSQESPAMSIHISAMSMYISKAFLPCVSSFG